MIELTLKIESDDHGVTEVTRRIDTHYLTESGDLDGRKLGVMIGTVLAQTEGAYGNAHLILPFIGEGIANHRELMDGSSLLDVRNVEA